MDFQESREIEGERDGGSCEKEGGVKDSGTVLLDLPG